MHFAVVLEVISALTERNPGFNGVAVSGYWLGQNLAHHFTREFLSFLLLVEHS